MLGFSVSACPPLASPSGEAGGDETEKIPIRLSAEVNYTRLSGHWEGAIKATSGRRTDGGFDLSSGKGEKYQHNPVNPVYIADLSQIESTPLKIAMKIRARKKITTPNTVWMVPPVKS